MFQVLKFDPQVLQRAPEEAGDVHLADAYVVCDLGLCLALVEAALSVIGIIWSEHTVIVLKSN